MKNSIRIVCFLLLAGILPAHALDKSKFVEHFRKALNLDNRTPVEVTDPVPTTFEGLKLATVTVQQNPFPVYFTTDEKFYFWGSMFSMATDYDKDRASKISLKNVRSMGSATAPIVMVEFSDLQCPNCSRAHVLIKEQLYKTYKKEQVRLVFKHFPLTNHNWAEAGSIAAECAGRQSDAAFWSMVEKIYDQAPQITPENVGTTVQRFAQDLKLKAADFTKCYDTRAPIDKIRADKTEGALAGVQGTPTIFVNGRLVRGGRWEDIQAVIEEKLLAIKK